MASFGTANSSEINKHIRALYDDSGGKLTADLLVDAAKPDSHPLHTHFEWNDTLAGHQHRLEQARRLIRSCKITFADATGQIRQVREFQSVVVRDPSHRKGSLAGEANIRVYRATEDVVTDTTSADALSRQFRLEWDNFRKRWENFDEFVRMFGPKPPKKP